MWAEMEKGPDAGKHSRLMAVEGTGHVEGGVSGWQFVELRGCIMQKYMQEKRETVPQARDE